MIVCDRCGGKPAVRCSVYFRWEGSPPVAGLASPVSSTDTSGHGDGGMGVRGDLCAKCEKDGLDWFAKFFTGTDGRAR